MADYTYTQNDTWPPLERTVTQTIGTSSSPVDLSLVASARWIMELTDGTRTIIKTLDTGLDLPAPRSDGVIRVDWFDGDFAEAPVLWNCELEVTYSNGKRETFPTTDAGTKYQIAVVPEIE